MESYDWSDPNDLVIDAFFGFGFQGSPKPPYEEHLKKLTQYSGHVISVDVPSGWPVDARELPPCLLQPETLISLSAPVPVPHELGLTDGM